MEDVSVDFDWVEADESGASDKSERTKELLRKLDRIKNQLPASPSLSPESGIRRDMISDGPSRETDSVPVTSFKVPDHEEPEVSSCVEAGGGLDPALDGDMADTLTRACTSHSADQTKYYCNDCKVFICIQCIAFGDHSKPCKVSQEEDSR